jgi:serine protease
MSIRPARALAAALLLAGGVAGLGSATAAPVQAQAAAEAPAEATGVIVGYRSSAPESTSLAAAREDAEAKTDDAEADGRVERRLSTGGVLVDLGEGTTEGELQAVLDEYAADPQVAYVEPDLVMQALAAPNDTEYARQWDLFEPTGGMNVENAWPLSTGSGQVVAVIDTGLVAHSDLAGQTVAGYDFISDATNANDGGGRDSDASDPGDGWNNGECLLQQPRTSSWHGTHVAGTIAAATGNAKGIAGIAHAAKVQPVRVLGKCGGSTSDIADAITWASGGTVSGAPANPTPADVINMSLGGQAACSSTYQNAINAAVNRGTTVVVAAGNSNANVSGFTPASCGNVIAVASTNRAGARAFYSNYGALIDVSAPGGETRNAAGTVSTPQNGIWSTLNTGAYGPGSETYTPYQGTSMAAPHIAGLAALMQARTPSLTPAQVETQIKATARPLPGACSGGCGAGIADAVAALGGGGTPTNDHSVAVSPTSRSVAAGASTTATVSTAVVSGSAQTLTLSATGLPTGATASFSPATVHRRRLVDGHHRHHGVDPGRHLQRVAAGHRRVDGALGHARPHGHRGHGQRLHRPRQREHRLARVRRQRQPAQLQRRRRHPPRLPRRPERHRLRPLPPAVGAVRLEHRRLGHHRGGRRVDHLLRQRRHLPLPGRGLLRLRRLHRRPQRDLTASRAGSSPVGRRAPRPGSGSGRRAAPSAR